VAIHLADQYAAVLMPHPFGNRHVVNPRHHAIADEVMPQIMKAEPPQTRRRSHQPHRLDKTFCRQIVRPALR